MYIYILHVYIIYIYILHVYIIYIYIYIYIYYIIYIIDSDNTIFLTNLKYYQEIKKFSFLMMFRLASVTNYFINCKSTKMS